MKEIQYGIIGCGYFGAELARTVKAVDGARITCCYSPGESSKRLSEELGCDREAELGQFLARADIDAVIIASPNNMHHDDVIAAAKAKKHIYCEKPFALSTRDADEMLVVCRENKVVLMVGHVMHYYEGIRRVKKWVDDGVLGEILTAHAERTGWENPKPEVSWKKQQSLSGGHVFHHIHEVDLMQWFMGPAENVFSLGGNLGHKGGGFGDEDDVIFITIKFKNGSFGTMQYGSGFRIGEHFLKINGTLGGAKASFQDNMLTLYKDNTVQNFPMFTDEESAADLNTLFQKTDGGISYGSPTDKPPAYITKAVCDEITDFHHVVCGGEIPERVKDLFDGSSARESVAIAYAAVCSRNAGMPVGLE